MAESSGALATDLDIANRPVLCAGSLCRVMIGYPEPAESYSDPSQVDRTPAEDNAVGSLATLLVCKEAHSLVSCLLGRPRISLLVNHRFWGRESRQVLSALQPPMISTAMVEERHSC